MSVILSFTLVLFAMTIGDIASTKTKAFLPSVFVTAVVFLLSFWYVFPSDMISKATLGQSVGWLSHVFVGIPPLTGGIVAAILMKDAAEYHIGICKKRKQKEADICAKHSCARNYKKIH